MKSELMVSFNALLSLAFTEAETRELAHLPDLETLNAEYVPSPELDARINVLINGTKQTIRKKQSSRNFRRVAAAFILTLALTACVFAPVQAVQSAVLSTVVEWYDKYIRFIFTSSNSDNISEMPANIEILYVPQGFVEKGNTINFEDIYSKNFDNKEAYIDIAIANVKNSHMIDIDAEISKIREIIDKNVSFIWSTFNDGSNMLVWNQNNLVFRISSSLSIDEILKIAHNIKY